MIDITSKLTKEQEAQFKNICEIEPRILDIYNLATSIKDDGGESFCANSVFHGFDHDGPNLKRDFSKLVGYGAEIPELATSEAYDIVYMKIFQALPDCRNCMCAAED